jgi:purine-binding chemotaxis protein CheW
MMFQVSGLHVCLFEIAGDQFGLPLESISEIVPMADLSRPPTMPSILEGFLNLGGRAFPVLKIAALLGLRQELLTLHTPLLILRGTQPLALLVDRALGIVVIEPGRIVAVSETDSFNGCVEGHVTCDDRTIHLLSLDRLLMKKEREVIAEFQATESKRLLQVAGMS